MHLLSSKLHRLSSCVNVPVYVSLQFIFGCLSVSLRTIKEKKQVCFFLFIHHVQVSI